MADSDEEKTEDATDARREDFRKRGQVAQSKELASSIILLASAGAIYGLSKFFLGQLFQAFNYSFGKEMVFLVREGQIIEALQFGGVKIIFLIAPVLLISLIIGLSSTLVQVGFLNVEDAMNPDLNKLNPVEGFKRIFSLKAVTEALKAVFKMSLILGILYLILKGEIQKFPHLLSYSISEILEYLGSITFRLLGGIGIFMLAITAADYFFLRWDLEKKMRMSKQEVKEESKSREGDPLIKARIRKIQREMASKRMMSEVPKGDVVITNPTHIAVVLKYDDKSPAPRLIAKGADAVAERIKAIARENNIPVIENKPLARTIFKTLKLGHVVPRELFVAVAEVFSFVYKLKRKKVRR